MKKEKKQKTAPERVKITLCLSQVYGLKKFDFAVSYKRA
jgi:hypothetical protein